MREERRRQVRRLARAQLATALGVSAHSSIWFRLVMQQMLTRSALTMLTSVRYSAGEGQPPHLNAIAANWWRGLQQASPWWLSICPRQIRRPLYGTTVSLASRVFTVMPSESVIRRLSKAPSSANSTGVKTYR